MSSCNSVGALGVVLSLLLFAHTGAEAKRISYEIDGQTYDYDSDDREQVEIARERITAANAADEARERASAERAAQPLVKIFGSQIQTEATLAEAELKRVLAATAPAIAERAAAVQPATKTNPRPLRSRAKEVVAGGAGGSPASMPTGTFRDGRSERQLAARATAPEETRPPEQYAVSRQAEPRGIDVARQEPPKRSTDVAAGASPEEDRARLIALFKARALAEEQRRLEVDKKRDRFAR